MTPSSKEKTYTYGGVILFLIILLYAPGLKEALDIRFYLNKKVYVSLHTLFIIIDLIFLFPLLLRDKTIKPPKLPGT